MPCPRWKEGQVDGSIPWDVENPFTGRRFRREGRGSSSPKGFSQGELTAYFKLPPFTRGDRPVRGKGDAIYWVPLLLLFTGARPEEVAQLLVSDIRQRESDGRWLIRFTDQGDHPVKGQQSLKTGGLESGQREFPVPQPLLELGLLRYCEYLRAKDELALFPLLRRKGKRSGLFASFGEWMGGYIYNHGVLQRSTGRQPVREFRHTWSTAARNSRIPREAMEYIQGHRAPGGGSSNEGYGERGGLGEHIDDLRLPVNVMSLVVPWSPPTDD